MLEPKGPFPLVIGIFVGVILIGVMFNLSLFDVQQDDKRKQLNRITWDRISELEVRVFLLEKKLGLNKMSP